MSFLRSLLSFCVRLIGAAWRWLRATAWPWYRGQTRRMQIIVGSATLIGLCACCGISGALNNSATNTDITSQQANTGSSSSTSSSSPSSSPAQPTATHAAATPKPHATSAPAPTQVVHPPTATPRPKYPAINNNPYDYNFQCCHVIYNPAGDICNWFNCIASFWNGTGYMNECADGTYSLSGGHQGDCSRHGDELRPVYKP